MVDYFEATLIDPRTLREAKEVKETRATKKIENSDVPTITINGKVEKLNEASTPRPRTKKATSARPKATKQVPVKRTKTINESHKNRKPKVVKAAMATDFSQPVIEEIKWDSKKLESRQVNVRHRTGRIVIAAIFAFIVCFGIVYQYSLVNASFMEKKKLEGQLAEILKQNEQLEVKIEGATNMKTISEEAKEQLGMQKIDNQQKVYVDLDKSDYIKPSNDN